VNGGNISGSALVLGGLVISSKKIWPRRKEVKESKMFSKVICDSKWRKMQISVGRSGEKHECLWVDSREKEDLCFGQVQADK
jgi:hypothetical protein